MRVFVYWNLHRNCLSVKAMQGVYANLVVAHAKSVQLSGVNFKVSQAGRARVLRDKAKNVHAGLVGELQGIEIMSWLKEVSSEDAPGMWEMRAKLSADFVMKSSIIEKIISSPDEGLVRHATYDPYRYGSFVDRESLAPVHESKCVDVMGSDILYCN